MHGDKYFKIIPPPRPPFDRRRRRRRRRLPPFTPFPSWREREREREERRTPVSRGMATIITWACLIEGTTTGGRVAGDSGGGGEGRGEEEKERNGSCGNTSRADGAGRVTAVSKYIRKFESSIRNNEARATMRTRRYGEGRGQRARRRRRTERR
jgi:hypothetical protein